VFLRYDNRTQRILLIYYTNIKPKKYLK